MSYKDNPLTGHSVPIRSAVRRGNVVPMWMCYKCGKGEIEGVKFDLAPSAGGQIVLSFHKPNGDADFERGRYVVEPMDFASAAFEHYKRNREGENE